MSLHVISMLLALKYCILWVGIALACLQSSMLFVRGLILKSRRQKIFATLSLSCALLAMLMIGSASFQLVSLTTISGHSFFLRSFTKGVLPIKQIFLLTIALLWALYLPMKR